MIFSVLPFHSMESFKAHVLNFRLKCDIIFNFLIYRNKNIFFNLSQWNFLHDFSKRMLSLFQTAIFHCDLFRQSSLCSLTLVTNDTYFLSIVPVTISLDLFRFPLQISFPIIAKKKPFSVCLIQVIDLSPILDDGRRLRDIKNIIK